jgi:hypothetical protein
MRSSIAGKGEFAVHSFVNKVYFWMSPRSSIEVGTDWSDREVVFTVPAPWKARLERADVPLCTTNFMAL